MAHSLKLEVLLAAVDKATAPLKRIDKATKAAAQAMRSTRKELHNLNKTQSDVEAYRRADIAVKRSAQALNQLKQQTDKVADAHAKAKAKQNDLSTQMTSAQRQFERLAKAMKSAGGNSSTLSNETDKTRLRMDQLRSAQAKASEEVQKHARRLRTLGEQESRTRHQTDEARRTIEAVGRRLREAGYDMNRLGRESRALNQNESRLNDTLKAQRKRLEELRQEQEKNTEAKEKAAKLRNSTAVGGAIGVATGSALLYGGYQTIDEAKHFDLEKNRLASLGIGQDMTNRLTKYATEMQGFGTSQLERMELMRDAMSVLGNEHHAKDVMPVLAKMKFANKALYGDAQAGEMEKKFLDMLKVIELRGGLNSTEEFTKQANMVQQIITATGGRVDATEYLNLIQTGKLAAKGIESKGFYYQLEPLVQEMGGHNVGTALMSAYNNLYQGKTTKNATEKLANLGLIKNSKAIKYDAIGQDAYIGPGALLHGELFRKNQIEWIRTVLIPQLKKKGVTKEQDIMDAVGSIISNRTASGLYGTIVQQLMNGSIDRRMLVNQNAEGIDQAESRAKGTAQGKEDEALARRHDLMQQLGTQLMPLYLEMLNKVNGALATFSGFISKHPVLANRAMKGLMIFGAVAVVVGGLSLALSALAGPVMMAVRVFGMLNAVMMMNPILALVAGIAIAAVLIWKYWKPIKKWLASFGIDFSGLSKFVDSVWGEVKEAFHGGLWGILKLIARWSPIGLLMRGLVWAWNGLVGWISSKMSPGTRNAIMSVVTEVKRAWDGAWSWMMDIRQTWINWLTSAWEGVKKFLRNILGNSLYEAGANLMNSLISGFTKGWQIMMQKLNDIKNAASYIISPPDQKMIEAEAGTIAYSLKGLAWVSNPKNVQSLVDSKNRFIEKISSKASTVHNVINVHVNALDTQNPQVLNASIRRELNNAWGELFSRSRSGMADRG